MPDSPALSAFSAHVQAVIKHVFLYFNPCQCICQCDVSAAARMSAHMSAHVPAHVPAHFECISSSGSFTDPSWLQAVAPGLQRSGSPTKSSKFSRRGFCRMRRKKQLFFADHFISPATQSKSSSLRREANSPLRSFAFREPQ